MPDRKTRLDRRYAAEQSKLSAAEASVRKASAAALAKWLRLPRWRRLRILAKPTPDLTEEDRQRLADSLARPKMPGVRHMGGGASSLRLSRLIDVALVVAIPLVYAGFALAIAVMNTPERWVRFDPNLDLEIRWSLDDGTPIATALAAAPHYLLYKRDGDDAVVRSWIKGVGYALTRVKIAWLQRAD